MIKLAFKFLIFIALVACSKAHYGMNSPVMRSFLWQGYPTQYRRDINADEWCEVRNALTNVLYINGRGSTCGVAGGVYNNDPTKDVVSQNCNPRGCENQWFLSYEDGSKNYMGQIVAKYVQGQDIEIEFQVNANHGGRVGFSVCKTTANDRDPPLHCFDKTESNLYLQNGDSYYQLPEDMQGRKFTRTFSVRLPAALTCDHCVLRYKVDKTLSPKTEMRDLYGNVMTNPSQVYVGAADIQIMPSKASNLKL